MLFSFLVLFPKNDTLYTPMKLIQIELQQNLFQNIFYTIFFKFFITSIRDKMSPFFSWHRV